MQYWCMKHRGTCALSPALRGLFFFRARMSVSPTVRYVPIAGHHVTCQGSRVLRPSFFFFFLSPPPSLFCVRSSAEPLWSTADPHGPDPPARISRSTLRKTDTSARMDGRGGSRTDVDGCFLNQDRLKWLFLATSCDFSPPSPRLTFSSVTNSRSEEFFFCLSFFFFFSWRGARRKKGEEGSGLLRERLGALEPRKVTDHAYGNFRFRLDKVYIYFF